ncbi:MAG: hypothetical protein MUO84_05655, partial [Thermoplasmata archaeon]|nr:hypothetical protein [Thermoplasmata archaeon]
NEGTYEVVVSKTGFETNDTVEVAVTAGEDASLVIYLTADKKGELSTTGIVVIAALAIIAAVAAVALLLKRKKGSEQAEEPPEPPEM